MYLTSQDRLKLQSALIDAFPTEDDLGRLAFRHLDKTTFSSSKLPDMITKGMIEWAEATDNLRKLLDAALAENPTNLVLVAVAGALRVKIDAAAPRYVTSDPFNVCLPRPNLPFVNRAPLRAALTSMAAPNGTPILAVQGEARTGKSHTAHLISYLSTAITQPNGQPLYRTVTIHLADHDAGLNASDLAMEIALQLGIGTDTIPKRTDVEQEARWASWVTSWIVGQIPAVIARLGCNQIWIVVDGFQQTPVAPSTHDVLRRLARAALNQNTMRVVLLDYTAALPDIERSVHRDHTRLATIADVGAHIQGIVDGTGRTIDAALKQQLTDAIWQEAGPEDKGFMERLDAAICCRLPTLLGAG